VPRVARRVALHFNVTFAVPLAGTVTGSADAVAETPLGNSLTPNVTAELNPLTLVSVSVVVTLPLSSIVNDAGDSDILNVAVPVVDGLTVSAIVVECVSAPDVPVTVMVAVPVAAAELAVSVNVLVVLPLAAGVTGFALNDAVTPLGRPDADSVTALANAFCDVMVTVLVPLAPCVTVTLLGDALTLKFGVAAAVTVSAIVVVADSAPDVPLIVTVDVPADALELAVRLNTLEPVVGFVPNDAVTPVGKPEAASVTAPEKPPASATLIVLVPAAPPAVIETLFGDADSVKLGWVVVDPARRLIRPVPFGLPQPVTRSYPAAA
jgi:hypothetical protein